MKIPPPIAKYPRLGYALVCETVDVPGTTPTRFVTAYTLDTRHYIGRPKWAFWICKTMGIIPEPATTTATVCTIGYSRRKRRYYGWSQLTGKIHGYRLGQPVTRFDRAILAAGYQVGYRPRTMDDLRKMAAAFAARA